MKYLSSKNLFLVLWLFPLVGILVIGSPSVHAQDKGPVAKSIQNQIDALQTRIATLEAKLQYMKAEGTDVIFEGCNVHVRNGLGHTWGTPHGRVPKVNHLGNLIVGYNENAPPWEENPEGYQKPDRSGSHNLVIGSAHSYPSYGGLVTGVHNTVTGEFASVTGGSGNTAFGYSSSISGGSGNIAMGYSSSVSSGSGNTTSGLASNVSGGLGNIASGYSSSVSGGTSNIASGYASSVTGGSGNTASGLASSVSGGLMQGASDTYDWRTRSYFQDKTN